MKKLISIALLISMLLAVSPLMLGCSSPGLEAEQITEILDQLLPGARRVAAVIYGDGLPTEQSFTEEEIRQMVGVQRFPVSANAEFTTREALRNAITAVFTMREAGVLMSDAFEGVAARFDEEHGVLRINVNHGEPLSVLQSIDSSSVRNVTGRSDRVEFVVDAVHEDGTATSVSIALAYEAGRWLLDGPAF